MEKDDTSRTVHINKRTGYTKKTYEEDWFKSKIKIIHTKLNVYNFA